MLSSLLWCHRLMATLLLLFFLTLSAANVSARQETKPLEPADLELVISGPHEDFPDRPPLGFHPRKFKMTLINHSSRPVVYGPNAPGGIVSYESPDWRVTGPDGKIVPLRPIYICRVGAPVRFPTLTMTDKNLFVVGPNESRDLGEVDISMWFKLSEPGEYKIYREFSFSPPRLAQITIGGMKYPAEYDASAMSPEKQQMLRDAAGFTVKSNVWTLVIK
jgi:hypothetical protein